MEMQLPSPGPPASHPLDTVIQRTIPIQLLKLVYIVRDANDMPSDSRLRSIPFFVQEKTESPNQTITVKLLPTGLQEKHFGKILSIPCFVYHYLFASFNALLFPFS